MALLANIIAAEEDEVEAIGESLHPVNEWSGIELRGMDTAKIATLHCLLTGDDLDMAIGAYEPVYVASEGALVLRLADEVAEKLAGLEEDAIDEVAAELAATEAFEMEGWAEEEVHTLVTELANLAQLAESQGQRLFVWMHPLMT